MSDNKDQISNNDDKGERGTNEKVQRRFDLRLIFILILGLSILFGILIFRNVKGLIKNPPQYQMDDDPKGTLRLRKGMNKLQRQEHFAQHSAQINKAARREKLALKGQPLHSRPVDKFPSRALPLFIDPSSLELIPLEASAKAQVQEVANLVALKKDYKENFDASDIVQEKMGRIFVARDKAQGLEGQERVSYNLRTKQLGVITGKLFLKFSSAEAFRQREQIYPKGTREQRIFKATELVILETTRDFSLNELLALERDLSELPQLKRVRAEVIEHGKAAQ